MKNIAICVLTLMMIIAPLAADDFDFGDLMGGDDTSMGFESAPAIEVAGSLAVPFRAGWGDWADSDSWDSDSFGEGSCSVNPDMTLDLSFSSDKAEFKADLNINEADLEDNLFDELSLTYYGDKMTAIFGWQKVVWGKGDKVHVLDLLNPMDYSDFLNPEYLDRKIAQPMINVAIPNNMNGKLELVFVPFFEADQLASDGAWMMGETKALVDTVTGFVKDAAVSSYASDYSSYYTYFTNSGYSAAQADAAANGAASAAQTMFLSENSSIDAFLPDTNSLKYFQAGTRYTATVGQVDLGAVYYIGRYRTPSVSGTDFASLNIDYDPMQVFGLEAGGILAGFNLRSEAAYYMTQDLAGDDPDVHNNSLNYVAGFDRDIPVHNLNVNFQATGSYMLNHDDTQVAGDVENGSDATETTLVLNVSDSFNHEKVKPEVTVTYRAEDFSGMVKPAVEWDVDGNLFLELSGTVLWGDEDTFFGQFDENDFISLEASYQF